MKKSLLMFSAVAGMAMSMESNYPVRRAKKLPSSLTAKEQMKRKRKNKIQRTSRRINR